MVKAPPPPSIPTEADYRKVLTDTSYWEPWVRWALYQADLPAPQGMIAGRDLTYPTFVCDTGLVVKLFSPHYAGPESHEVEAEAYELLGEEELPVPSLVASGDLYPGNRAWPWPYLVLTELRGMPYSSLRGSMGQEPKERIAMEIGELLRRLHRLPLVGKGPLQKDWGRFLNLLRRRRGEVLEDELRWGRLSETLCHRIDGFLPDDPAELLDLTIDPVFVHGDLHAEHIYVDPQDGALKGILDFTDAYAGDPRYDLLALHTGTFEGDKELLSACLEGYGWPALGSGWAMEMLAFTFLHDFDLLAGLPAGFVDLRKVEDPETMARLLWGV